MPRFLLHRFVFDHGLVDGLGPDQPRLQGNQLRRKDWIQLREITRSEWVILPVQEVAAHLWCTECEHPRSGTCPEVRRAKWAPHRAVPARVFFFFFEELASQPWRSFQR